MAVSLWGMGAALLLGLVLGAILAPSDVWSVHPGEPKANQLDPNYAAYLKVMASQPAVSTSPLAAARVTAAPHSWPREAVVSVEESDEWIEEGAAEIVAASSEPELPAGPVAWPAEPQPPPVPLPSTWSASLNAR